MALDLDPVIWDTLADEGGSLAISHRPRLRDGVPPYRAMLSFSGGDHPAEPGLPPRAAYGYGTTVGEAWAALADDLRERLAEETG